MNKTTKTATSFITLIVLISCGSNIPLPAPRRVLIAKNKTQPIVIDPNPLCHLEQGKYQDELLEDILSRDVLDLFEESVKTPCRYLEPGDPRELPPESRTSLCSVSQELFKCQCFLQDTQP